MKNLITLFAIATLLVSCDIQRKVQRSETDTDFNENIKTETARKGDTVRYKIPMVTFRDTTIYTISRQGTQLVTRYDTNGRLSDIECRSAEIRELREEIRNLAQNTQTKDKEESSEFDSTIVLYIAGAIMLVFMLALFLLFIYIKNNTKAITSVLGTITK